MDGGLGGGIPTQTSFIIMSNQGRLPASGLGAKCAEGIRRGEGGEEEKTGEWGGGDGGERAKGEMTEILRGQGKEGQCVTECAAARCAAPARAPGRARSMSGLPQERLRVKGEGRPLARRPHSLIAPIPPCRPPFVGRTRYDRT